MARIKVKGLEELIRKVEEAGRRPEGLVKRALYEGAGLMADEIRGSLLGIPVDNSFGTPKHKKHGVTATEKVGLIRGLGISKMREEGIGQVALAIGFNGANSDGTRNTTVMRRIESGTSRTQKIPTIRPTKNRARKPALAAMQKQFEKDVSDIFK